MDNEMLWKRKLHAFLHDPPDKAMEIHGHQERAASLMSQAGIRDADIDDREADRAAASADRIPFPKGRISCDFKGGRNGNKFHHPLNGASRLGVEGGQTALHEAQQVAQPILEGCDDRDSEIKARANFFAHWRLQAKWLTKKDARFAFLPADTRLPDHTIFHHNTVAAAFAGCFDESKKRLSPALLRFHLGPVQSFIAAARTTRDLWSGSYLLSYLVATGLKRLAEQVGPDSVVFPNLLKQPIFDLLWSEELWKKLHAHESTRAVWFESGIQRGASEILTPNCPNVFLALVPAEHGEEIARSVENAIRSEWKSIADSVWSFSGLKRCKERFDRQVDRFLALPWQVTPFPDDPDSVERAAEVLPGKDLDRFRELRGVFERTMPEDARDSRMFDASGRLNNVAFAWPLMVALNAWQLDATRQTRAFDAWSAGGAAENFAVRKDALNGKEEAIPLAGMEDALRSAHFRHGDPVGASTLIKRLWWKAFLEKRFELDVKHGFPMPNTRSCAEGLHYKDDAETDVDKFADGNGKYFAVIAFDGDDMGKWVSGEKTPPFSAQLADYRGENGEPRGAVVYYESLGEAGKSFLESKRPVTPSYHMQFSEALSNFALDVAPRIVAAHKGKLIYAGGDDVLAMVPATEALACADDLQRAFSGRLPKTPCGLAHPDGDATEGFFCLEDHCDQQGRGIPFLVPGPAATASVGIAMAHFKAPLQDAVRAAGEAEKRAKKSSPRKNSFAVSIFKRSGEITEWDDSFREFDGVSAASVFETLTGLLRDEVLSARFPHALLELLEPYRSAGSAADCPEFDFIRAVEFDIEAAIERQRGRRYDKRRAMDFKNMALRHLARPRDDFSNDRKRFAGMLSAAAFLARQPRRQP